MTDTLGELAAKLVVEGSLDVIANKPGAVFPLPGGLALSDARRAELGRPAGGGTVFYAAGELDPARERGVFVDFQDSATTVWFRNGDGKSALKILDTALRKAYPKTKQQGDSEHRGQRGARHRSYDVPLSAERAAVIDVAYPSEKNAEDRFVVRITAFAKPEKH